MDPNGKGSREKLGGVEGGETIYYARKNLFSRQRKIKNKSWLSNGKGIKILMSDLS